MGSLFRLRSLVGLMLGVLGAAAATAPSPRAEATVVIALTVEDMSVKAAAVVRARVQGAMSAWDEAHRRIYTYTELEVLETWRGEAPATIVVRTLGGQVDDIGMRVSGTASFSVGEEVVLFLRADPKRDGQFHIIGLSQGKYRVETRSDGVFAVPSVEGLALAQPDPTGRVRIGGASTSSAMPIERLRARVSAVAAGAAPSPPPAAVTPPQAPVATPPARPAVPVSPPTGETSPR